MRLTLRQPAERGCDGELVALAVLVASSGFAILWLALGLPTPACAFHAITGLPCLTCGGTRCVRSLLAGQVGAALGWNPLVFVGVLVAGLFAIYAAIVTSLRLPRLRLEALTPPEALTLRLAVLLVAAANWIYLIVRFSHGG
jgi:hypothetical protein